MQFDLEDFETAFWIVLLFVLIDIAITLFDVPLKRWRGAELSPVAAWGAPAPTRLSADPSRVGADFPRFPTTRV